MQLPTFVKKSPMEEKEKVQIHTKYPNTLYCANKRKEHRQTQKQKQLSGRVFRYRTLVIKR